MLNFKEKISGSISAVLTVVLLSVTAGCSSVRLGEIDETLDNREDMPGPGILSGSQGISALKWSSDRQSPVNRKEDSHPQKMDDISEFELYKGWKKLRSEGKDSVEYQEFLQWLEFQKLKAPQ